MIKFELKRALRSKSFMITLIIAIAIAFLGGVWSIVVKLDQWNSGLSFYRDSNGNWIKNPGIMTVTLFNSWIGGEYSTWSSDLFYFLLPLFSVLPYSWSLLLDEKTGYIKNVIVRSTREHYYLCKYIACFLSGALVIFLPLIVNYVLVACFIPARMPDSCESIYYAVFIEDLWSWSFYNIPFFYDMAYIFMASIFSGLWATIPLALCFYLKNRTSIIVGPFIFLIFMQIFVDALFAWRIYFEVSPMRFLRACKVVNTTNGYVLACLFIFLLVFSLGTILLRGRHRDVF